MLVPSARFSPCARLIFLRTSPAERCWHRTRCSENCIYALPGSGKTGFTSRERAVPFSVDSVPFASPHRVSVAAFNRCGLSCGFRRLFVSGSALLLPVRCRAWPVALQVCTASAKRCRNNFPFCRRCFSLRSVRFASAQFRVERDGTARVYHRNWSLRTGIKLNVDRSRRSCIGACNRTAFGQGVFLFYDLFVPRNVVRSVGFLPCFAAKLPPKFFRHSKPTFPSHRLPVIQSRTRDEQTNFHSIHSAGRVVVLT